MEYYSTIKKNEILPFTTRWMDLEGMMLSEIQQIEIDKYCILSLICGLLNIKQANEYNKTAYSYREQASGSQW